MTSSSLQIFVTGGAGYIGSVLTRRLLDEGHQVTVLGQFHVQPHQSPGLL